MVIWAGMKILKEDITSETRLANSGVQALTERSLQSHIDKKWNICAQYLSFTFIKALDTNILRGGKWILLYLFNGNISEVGCFRFGLDPANR